MKYIISWKEEENTIKFEPSQIFNAEGKVYTLKKISIVEFVLKSENEETHSSLGGCLERLKNEMDTEDFINLASLLYTWGMYNGVHG
jgi:hypothetical protein